MLCSHFIERVVQLSFDVTYPGGGIARNTRTKIAFDLRLSVLTYAKEMTRPKLMDAVQNGPITLERVAKFQELPDGAAINRRAKSREFQKGLELGGEHDAAGRWLPIVKRLDAHRIAKQKQGTLGRAPKGKRVHPADIADAFSAPGRKCIKQYFSVGFRAKAIAV